MMSSSIKLCRKCDLTKETSLFNKCSRQGTQSKCKECEKVYRLLNTTHIKTRNKAWYEENIKEIKAGRKSYRDNNKELIREQKSLYYNKNKKSIIKKVTSYTKLNRGQVNARGAYRRAKKIKATLEGYSEDIKMIYVVAKEIQEQTGTYMHVDHIVPLNNPLVCGLHVPWNLQIITAEENCRKSNKF